MIPRPTVGQRRLRLGQLDHGRETHPEAFAAALQHPAFAEILRGVMAVGSRARAHRDTQWSRNRRINRLSCPEAVELSLELLLLAAQVLGEDLAELGAVLGAQGCATAGGG